MDGNFGLDLQDVMATIDKAEVISLFFPTFRRAVVIDTRSNEDEGPMVRIMPMVASPQERLRTLRRLRRRFPPLHSLTLIPWPRYVDSLVRLGVWQRIVNRFAASGHEQAVKTCGEVLEGLRQLEKDELIAAVRAVNYRTIWSARG